MDIFPNIDPAFLWGSFGAFCAILVVAIVNRFNKNDTTSPLKIEFLGLSNAQNKAPLPNKLRRDIKINENIEYKVSTRRELEETLSVSTLSIIADKHVEDCPDIAAPLHVSTTYRKGNSDNLSYSRVDLITRRRVEKVIGELEGGKAVLYGSGLAALSAVLHLLRPKKVAAEKGYFQSHKVFELFSQSIGLTVVGYNDELQKGDIYYLETPNNPCCLLYDIKEFVAKAQKIGAYVVVDSTFATPILQNPLQLGADIVLHSCTKALGGHSDLLGGVLIANSTIAGQLGSQRMIYGDVIGNLESWLLLRSLRTLKLRVKRQGRSAAKLAVWLEKHPKVTKVWHPILSSHPCHEIYQKQMRFPPACFSIELATSEAARDLPKRLRLFSDATSLGGVESLIDYRYAYDSSVSPCLLRLSVGLESAKDLIADLDQALTVDEQL